MCNNHRMKSLNIPRVCEGCGEPFLSHSNRGRFCTNPCRQRHRKGSSRPANCVTCGAKLGLRRQKYCQDECRPVSRKDGVTEPLSVRRVEKCCRFCGESFSTGLSNKIFCKPLCEQRSRTGVPLRLYDLVKGCQRCGESFKGGRSDRVFCSPGCQTSWNAEKRRARKRGLPVEAVSRAEIHSRDEMICHLCGTRVDGETPVIDHVIPIAHPDCPGHVWENLATAHRLCNERKGVRVRSEDYSLVERLRASREVMQVCRPGAATPRERRAMEPS